MKCIADINVPIMMNCNNYVDPLTFLPAPLSGQNFNLSSTLVCTEPLSGHIIFFFVVHALILLNCASVLLIMCAHLVKRA